MDKDNTVFILGAGASCPYDLPTAFGLRKLICDSAANLLRKTSPYRSDQDEREIMLYDVDILSQTFTDAGDESIDIFLSRNQKLSVIGKQAILASIFDCEINSRFNERMQEVSQNWYQFFFGWLTREQTGPKSFDLTNTGISIITFNYDRSLEHYLFTSAINSFQEIERTNIIDELRKIKILHVYGKAAPLEWENPSQNVPYGAPLEKIDTRMFIENIDVINSDRNCEAISEAIDLIKRAQNIVILGFGYRDENMKLLNFPQILKGTQNVYGTAFEALDEEIVNIKSRYMGPVQRGGGVLYIEKVDCKILLRKYLDYF